MKLGVLHRIGIVLTALWLTAGSYLVYSHYHWGARNAAKRAFVECMRDEDDYQMCAWLFAEVRQTALDKVAAATGITIAQVLVIIWVVPFVSLKAVRWVMAGRADDDAPPLTK